MKKFGIKKWLYLNIINKFLIYYHRNDLVTWWSGNYECRVWSCETPLPLKELLKKRYFIIGRSK